MEMIAAAEVHEDDDNYQSLLDILFERLEMREPDSIACKQYRIFKQAAGKTAKSILVSVGVRLGCIQPAVHRQADDDGRAALAGIGRTQNCTVLLHPDSDKSFNYLVRHDLHAAYSDAVPPSGSCTQRTLACAGALPDG